MLTKKELIKTFQSTPEKYWYLDFFKENDFSRRKCRTCGKYFWTLTDQMTCNDSSCRPYDFIGNPPTKKPFDYFSAWRAIEKFFVSNGHTALERYPVLCRWFPDLYFTIAGIVDFYRLSGKELAFEFPANPLILPQICLRFNDIPQVGVSGRHFTSFCMVQQSSLFNGKKGYWKERCIELDYELLTKVFGIKPEEIAFIEDAWLGAGAFGYSLEYHVQGLELGNAVFTEFIGTLDNYRTMDEKIVDMGAGLERFCWISQGTPTAYDAVFGSLIEDMRKKAGVEYDKNFFLNYAKLSGSLNIDEVSNIELARGIIARKLRVSKEELMKKIEPIEAIYAIADHAKTLAFAIADGGLPSNVAGGYNLRVVLRRALSLIEKHKFPFDIYWVAEQTAKYFKPSNKELLNSLGSINKMLEIEEKRYKKSTEKIKFAIDGLKKKNEDITESKLIELYDSHGITPELLKEHAGDKLKIEIPADFYAKVTERHMKEKEEKKEKIDVSGLPDTRQLYYENEKMFEFYAKVLKIIDKKYVVLNQTAFYPRGGGAEPDLGNIEGKKVFNVEKAGSVIVHFVENPEFQENKIVKCVMDKQRRIQIMRHHTATHIINGAARKVLGHHVWQAGSKKDSDKAHLDITHYEALSEEQMEKIEELANEIICKKIIVSAQILPRSVAEERYGFRLYQGGAVPEKYLRVISIGSFDVEACGGMHVNNTEEVGKIVLLKSEKIQDGIARLIYTAGDAAEWFLKSQEAMLKDVCEELDSKEENVPKAVESLFSAWKEKKKELEKARKERAERKISELVFERIGKKRFLVSEVPNAGLKELQEISKRLSEEDKVIVLFGTADRINVFGSAGAKTGVDIGKLVSAICKELEGSGGGSASLAQGYGKKKDKLEEVIKKIRHAIK